jgi:hypothetical protein
MPQPPQYDERLAGSTPPACSLVRAPSIAVCTAPLGSSASNLPPTGGWARALDASSWGRRDVASLPTNVCKDRLSYFATFMTAPSAWFTQ